jgi:hypothetical protein
MARTGAAGAEDYRIAMQARLETLLRGDEESIAFSPELTAEERAFLHALAPKFGREPRYALIILILLHYCRPHDEVAWAEGPPVYHRRQTE